MGSIRRDTLDAAFSALVRERAGWVSEYSGKSEGKMECAHIYSRSKRSTRWHPLNAVCLTHWEHQYFHGMPVLFTQWIQSKLGPDNVYKLGMMAATPRKFTPRERAGLLKHYRAELERLRTARANGRVGRIEFNFPDPIPEATPRGKAKKKRKPQTLEQKMTADANAALRELARFAKKAKPSKFKRKVDGTTVLRDA